MEVVLEPTESSEPLLSLSKLNIFSSRPSELHVAFLHEYNEENSAWVRAHEKGRSALANAFTDRVILSSHENVDPEVDAEQILEEVAHNGADVVFTTSVRMHTACLKVAAQHPKIKFLNCSLNTPHPLVRTYYPRTYEATYILGMLAGILSPTNTVGYVATNPVYGTPAAINAYAQGLRSVRPEGRVLLRWACLPDPAHPDRLRPMREQPKMFDVFREQHRWQEILGVTTIGEFNEECDKGHTNDLINVSEALQEKKISRIADKIHANPQLKVVLIAGPSSSGKTTFSKRLSVQLMASGLKPEPISLDDYFVDRVKTPRDAEGNYDYENIEAMDIPLFNSHINALLAGGEVELPRYNFQTGRSETSGRQLRLTPRTILILEGIHALNPSLTAEIPDERKYKIYASALTTILLDDHNYIPTTDNRLLRRIVRDYKYRGHSAEATIRQWPSVRAGEERWIFPYQEQADEMVNTALLFELAALRSQALPLLEQVPENVPEYSEAYRLRKFLSYLKPISTKGLPPTSLLREFLGGSTFKY